MYPEALQGQGYEIKPAKSGMVQYDGSWLGESPADI
jgi:hypothetical protein